MAHLLWYSKQRGEETEPLVAYPKKKENKQKNTQNFESDTSNQRLRHIPNQLPPYPSFSPTRESAEISPAPIEGYLSSVFATGNVVRKSTLYPSLSQLESNTPPSPKTKISTSDSTPQSSPRDTSPTQKKQCRSPRIGDKEYDQKEVNSVEETSSRKCKRCGEFYTKNSKKSCQYHSGKFKIAYSSPLLSGANIEYWTCCKSTKKNEVGCKLGKHKEDTRVQQILQNFPIVKVDTKEEGSNNIQTQSTQTEPQIQKEKTTKQQPKEIENYNVFRHYVTETDTMIGLTLRYSVSSRIIRQINHMPNDDVQGFSVLYIPKKGCDISIIEIPPEDLDIGTTKELTEEQKMLEQKRLLVRLRGQTGMTIEEADFYLKVYGYSYNDALREYKDDIEWEKKTPFVKAKKVK